MAQSAKSAPLLNVPSSDILDSVSESGVETVFEADRTVCFPDLSRGAASLPVAVSESELVETEIRVQP